MERAECSHGKALRRCVLQKGSHITSKLKCDLNTVVCWCFQQQHHDFQGQSLMCNLLVAQVGNKLQAANCHAFVIALEGLQKLQAHAGVRI